MKLVGHTTFAGRIKVLNGLRIGSGNDTMQIGGLDNPIIRHPITKMPYLPGSSLKGKLRCLLEQNHYKSKNHTGDIRPKRESQGGSGPCTNPESAPSWLFGCGDARATIEPTRLIFRDCFITPEWQAKLRSLLGEGIMFSETKAEVVMDRKTGKVAGAGPRTMDRIMAGTELEFQISVRLFAGDDKNEIKDAVVTALKLLHKDTLGGSGSRGYGWVGFPEVKFDGQDITREVHTDDELGMMGQL